MINESKNIIVDRSFRFALKIIDTCETLEEKKKFVISRQLLKSGTSIGANVREAQGAESRSDFIHKIKIAYKEAEETEYWLLLCQFSPSIHLNFEILPELNELKKILAKIICTSKSNMK